jgi:Flp pilus assembly protein protease CpaA
MANFFSLNILKELLNEPILLILLNVFFIIATYTDIKWMKIYNKFNIVMLIVRIVTFFIFGFSFQYLLGGFLMFATVLVGAMMTNARIGGDIKFSGNIGLWLGFMPSIAVLGIALITNLIFRKITKNVKAIALAPFLYLGFIILCVITYFFV